MISDAYRELLAEHARENPTWAAGGARHRDTVLSLIKRFGCATVLDYGCGRGTLGNSVMGRDKHNPPAAVQWFDYDPAFNARAVWPASADLVVCTHVLEHVEPELLDETIAELGDLTRIVLYVAVPLGPARAVLPDGRNAHLTQKPQTWWRRKLARTGGAVELMGPTRPGEARFVVCHE